jgi:hypothetical protein
VKRLLVFLTQRWTPREAAATLLVTIMAAYSVANLRDWQFGGVVVFLMLLVQGFMWYSTGRSHQSGEDAETIRAAAEFRREAHQLVMEAYLFEAWFFNMSADPEHKHIIIQSRVSVN